MTKFNIVNYKTFEKKCNQKRLYAEGLVDDLSFKASETYAGYDVGRSVYVETGRRCHDGDVEYAEFETVNKYEFNEDGDVINELKFRFINIY